MIYKEESHYFASDDLRTLDSLIPDSDKKTQIFNRLERALEHEKNSQEAAEKRKNQKRNHMGCSICNYTDCSDVSDLWNMYQR